MKRTRVDTSNYEANYRKILDKKINKALTQKILEYLFDYCISCNTVSENVCCNIRNMCRSCEAFMCTTCWHYKKCDNCYCTFCKNCNTTIKVNKQLFCKTCIK